MAPGVILASTLAMQAAGTAMSAGLTIAGGDAQKGAYDYQAAQLRQQEGTDIGVSQRQMLDKQQQTRLAQSTLQARAAAGGINAGEGSPLATEQSIARRGTYQALMELWNGENRASGLENQAQGLEYSGDVAKRASRIAAMSTIAGGASKMISSIGAYAYPTQFGRPGVSYG